MLKNRPNELPTLEPRAAVSAFNIMRNYRKSLEMTGWVDAESGFPDSETLPDGTHSLRDLLVRHARGIEDSVMLPGSYSGDLPDLRGIEPHDLAVMIDETNKRSAELQALQEMNVIKIREEQARVKREKDLQLLKELRERQADGTI